jgi:hypothetical protein
MQQVVKSGYSCFALFITCDLHPSSLSSRDYQLCRQAVFYVSLPTELSANEYRQVMRQRFESWCELTGVMAVPALLYF